MPANLLERPPKATEFAGEGLVASPAEGDFYEIPILERVTAYRIFMRCRPIFQARVTG
jgi:hypothetical protein